MKELKSWSEFELINKDNNHDSKFYYHNKHLSLVDKFKKLV